jgi:hypothetical protein
LISGDAFVSVFGGVFPQLEINHEQDWDKTCQNLETFLHVYMKHLTLYEYIPFILDSFHVTPEQVVRLGWDKIYHVIFMGYPDIDPEQKLKDIRQNQTNHYDWTSERTDDELRQSIAGFIERSVFLQKEATERGLNFINMSYDFEDEIENAYCDLLNRNITIK